MVNSPTIEPDYGIREGIIRKKIEALNYSINGSLVEEDSLSLRDFNSLKEDVKHSFLRCGGFCVGYKSILLIAKEEDFEFVFQLN
jgi:hypothetical protein